MQNMLEQAKAIEDFIVDFRHQLHMYPELGFQEFRTTEKIEEELKKLLPQIQQKREQRQKIREALEKLQLNQIEDVYSEMEAVSRRGGISWFPLILTLLSAAAGGLQLWRPVAEVSPYLFFGAALLLLVCTVAASVNRVRGKRERLEKLQLCRELCVRMEAMQSELDYLLRQQQNAEEKSTLLAGEAAQLEERLKQQTAAMPERSQELVRRQMENQTDYQKLQWTLEQCYEEEEEQEERLGELNRQLARIAEGETELQAVDLAIAKIDQVGKKIKESFGLRLNYLASMYIAAITDDKYKKVVIDDKMNIFVHTDRKVVEASGLSKGTLEQLYLSLRLAAADIIFEKEHKPILLDDAFVMYDNRRMAAALEALSGLMEQVLIFTCHTREKVVLDKNNISYNMITLR